MQMQENQSKIKENRNTNEESNLKKMRIGENDSEHMRL